MVRAWYMDESTADQRLPHQTDPPTFLSLEEVKEATGIVYWKIDADNHVEDQTLLKIRKDRNYSYMDEICCQKTMDCYEQKIKMFYEEHLHSDEEIRLVLAGSGYFDARDRHDRWIRVEVVKGDMLVLPAGVYHRFTLDTNDYIVAKRFFQGEPVWKAFNRSEATTCKHPARQSYAKAMST